MQYFKVRGVRIEVLHAINSPSSYSPLFCTCIVIVILITHVYVRAHTHTHIYIWLLASGSHCFQLVFAPTLLFIPPCSCQAKATSFFPCWLSKGQQETPLETEAAELRCCMTPHRCPRMRNRVTDGQLPPPEPQVGGEGLQGVELPNWTEPLVLLCQMKRSEGMTWSNLYGSSPEQESPITLPCKISGPCSTVWRQESILIESDVKIFQLGVMVYDQITVGSLNGFLITGICNAKQKVS